MGLPDYSLYWGGLGGQCRHLFHAWKAWDTHDGVVALVLPLTSFEVDWLHCIGSLRLGRLTQVLL